MKKYIDAQLQVVRMNNHDIVTESLSVSGTDYNGKVYAPGQRDIDSWYEGY